MSMTVVGLYPTREAAQSAVHDLENSGFGDLPTRIETGGTEQSTYAGDGGGGLMEYLLEAGVPQDDAEIYIQGLQQGGSLLIVEAPDEQANTAARIINPEESARQKGQPSGQRKGDVTAEEETRMTEAHEELNVGKRQVQGGVRIHKRVKERPVEEQVHLHDEEVDVERRASTEASSTASGDAFEEETVEMRETREEPVVEKETHVEGEVVAQKRARDRTETVRDTVRETEIDIEDIDEDFHKRSDEFQKHYESSFADSDQDYADYESAYRLGYAYGNHEDYAGRDYEEVEPDMRRQYEERHGKGTFDRVRDAVRHSFGRSRQ